MFPKYIVFNTGYIEQMIIFPAIMDHDKIAKLFEPYKSISAGQVSLEDKACFGESLTLGISSRKQIDTNLLRKLFFS